MKLTTILIALFAFYMASIYYRRYMDMEREIKTLRAKCPSNITNNVKMSTSVTEKFDMANNALVSGLKVALSKMPPMT